MKFLENVQKRKLPWPTNRNFDINLWKLKYQELSESKDDLQINIAGLWITEKLTQVREMVELVSVSQLKFDEFAQGILAMCNLDYINIMQKAEGVTKKFRE